MNDNIFESKREIRDILDIYKHDLIEIYEPKFNVSYYRLYQKFLSDFENLLTKYNHKSKVLDVGCAQGNFTEILVKLGFNVTAIDINPNYVKYTKEKIQGHNQKVEVECFNVYDFDRPGEYDIIFAGEVIEHVKNPEQFLSHLTRQLKKDGILILTTPNQKDYRNKLPSFGQVDLNDAVEFFPDGDGHIFLYKPSEIEKLITKVSGLIKVKTVFYRSLFLCGDLKLRKLHRFIPEKIHFLMETFIQKIPISSKFFSQMLFVIKKNG